MAVAAKGLYRVSQRPSSISSEFSQARGLDNLIVGQWAPPGFAICNKSASYRRIGGFRATKAMILVRSLSDFLIAAKGSRTAE